MKSLFIAEAGINHHGSLSKAFRMANLAKEAGADIFKMQYYDPMEVLGEESPYLAYALSCYLSKSNHEKLARHCSEIGIEYLVSVFDIKDIRWADSMCLRHKIATRMNKDIEFLHYINETKRPVIMSIQPDTSIRKCYRDRFYFMWCVPEYPTDIAKLDLPYSYKYGLSSHCPDYKESVNAYMKGARIFENHVCESKQEVGCDIPASITFEDYKRMTDEIKYLHQTLETDGR